MGSAKVMSDGKECNKCKVYKPYSEFNKSVASKDGYVYSCKECRKEYYKQNREKMIEREREYYKQNKERIAQRHKEYYQRNKDKIAEKDRIYRENNKDKIAEYKKRWRRDNKEKNTQRHKEYYQQNKERITQRHKEYYQQNKQKTIEKNAEYQKERYQNDPAYRLRKLVSVVVRDALNNNNGSKEGNSTWDALPYTPQQLREHLEAQFEEGMTWDNYGHDGWHVDHIYPQSLLPYESMDDDNFRLAWDLRNLRPLWAAENISKGNEIIEGAEELLLEIKKDLDNNSKE